MGGGNIPGPETGHPSGGNTGVATQFGAGKPGPIAAKQGVQQNLALNGWPRIIAWDEFRNVSSRPSGSSEDADIKSETMGGEVQIRESRGRWLITEMSFGIEIDEDLTWVVESVKTDDLLAHEQGHFDIHGIIVGRDVIRAMRRLRERSQARLAAAIRRTMTRQQERGQAMTDRYDEDTDHGTVATQQAAWQRAIERAISNHSSLRAPD